MVFEKKQKMPPQSVINTPQDIHEQEEMPQEFFQPQYPSQQQQYPQQVQQQVRQQPNKQSRVIRTEITSEGIFLSVVESNFQLNLGDCQIDNI